MGYNVLAAMSGGIDSSAAALLLKEDGHKTDGATMLFYPSSPTEDSLRVAKRTCELLGMRHYTLDFQDAFREHVIKKFAESYMRGETPNPCVDCNRRLKFAEYIREADRLGYEKIATGHYAQTEFDAASGRWILKKGIDETKDQSYFLYTLSQNDLAHTLFPLGKLTKAEIREIVKDKELPSAHRAESQDICFLPDGDYKTFIEREFGYKGIPGNFVDSNGNVLGRHEGAIAYTLGQRRGLGVPAESRLYVLGKDMTKNEVTLGKEQELFTKRINVSEINLIAVEKITAPTKIDVKIRYSRSSAEAMLFPEENGSAVIEFIGSQRAPARGQAAVFYDGDTVIGGGTIC